MQKLAIECTAEAGGEICVVHPMNDAALEENAEMYAMPLPFAREHGVKIATENMYNWDSKAVCGLLDIGELPSPPERRK